MKTTVKEIRAIYAQATGTEHWYQHWSKRGCYTDGVRAVAEKAGAYWLIDAIFSWMRSEPFQIWSLVVRDGKAELIMKEDSGAPEIVAQSMTYTDFPEGTWKFYLENNVLMLPGER